MRRYRIRIPAEITSEGYMTRRPQPSRIHTAYYELHISEASDLTEDEVMAVINKMANIGGMGNLRVTVIELGDETEE